MKRTELVSHLRPVLLAQRADRLRSLYGEWSLLAFDDDEPHEEETLTRLSISESRELHAIDEALQRMRDGTYGVCEDCGRTISLARLEALPYATTCIQCQRRNENHPAIHTTRDYALA